MVHLCHCSGLLSRFWWWRCVLTTFWDIREDLPGIVSWYPGDRASSTWDAGLQLGQAWRDAKLRMSSWPLCWINGLRLMLRWMLGTKGCDEVVLWGFGWPAAAGFANGELRRPPHSALTPRAGVCCCCGGRLGFSFCWAFFPSLIWVTWG